MTSPNSPVSLPTDKQLDAAEVAYDAEPEGAGAHRRGLGRAYLAMKAVRPKEQVEGQYWPFANSGIRCVGFGKTLHDARNNVVFAFDEDEDATIDRVAECLNATLSAPKEQVEGLVERVQRRVTALFQLLGKLNSEPPYVDRDGPWGSADLLDDLAALSQPSPTVAVEGLREALEGLLREFEKFSRYGSPIAMAANEAVQRAQAALSQPSSPDVIRAPDGLDESHYRGLAGGVPVSSNEDAETLADELHSLIWEAGKTAAPIEGYPVSKAEEGAFQYGKDCATADIEQGVLQHLNRIANTLEAKPVSSNEDAEWLRRGTFVVSGASEEVQSRLTRIANTLEAKPVLSNEDAEWVRAIGGERYGCMLDSGEIARLNRIANTLEAKPVDGEGVVEKVARAICWAMSEETGDCSSRCLSAKRCMADNLSECFKRDARAAIEALSRGITLDAGQVSVRVEPATAQTLMDWNVLHFTDEGWIIDLDIWRRAKPVDGEGLIERANYELRAFDEIGAEISPQIVRDLVAALSEKKPQQTA